MDSTGQTYADRVIEKLKRDLDRASKVIGPNYIAHRITLVVNPQMEIYGTDPETSESIPLSMLFHVGERNHKNIGRIRKAQEISPTLGNIVAFVLQ